MLKTAESVAKTQLKIDHDNLRKRQWWLRPGVAMEVVKSQASKYTLR